MQKFNYDLYKKGREVRTRDGRKVTDIYRLDAPNLLYPLVGVVEGSDYVQSWQADGTFAVDWKSAVDEHDLDLFILDYPDEMTTRFKPEVMQCEQNYISPELGWAGTVDRIIRLNGKTYLIDIKTSNAIYQTDWLQLAAYRRLVEVVDGISFDGVGILLLNAKTRTEGSKGAVQGVGWQLVTQDDTTKELSLWLAQHANDLPKNSSYSLTHKK